MTIDNFIAKPKYQQPYSIRHYDNISNDALKDHYIHKEHHRQKYMARWYKSKQSKRNYENR